MVSVQARIQDWQNKEAQSFPRPPSTPLPSSAPSSGKQKMYTDWFTGQVCGFNVAVHGCDDERLDLQIDW